MLYVAAKGGRQVKAGRRQGGGGVGERKGRERGEGGGEEKEEKR